MKKMNKFLGALSLLIPLLAHAGVSVAIGEPGFYGSIDIGNAPPVSVYSAQPMVMAPVPNAAPIPPAYLYVPPEHRAHWDRYCGQYNACGRPVYFVTEEWYRNVYVPHYQVHHEYYQGRHEYEEHRHY